MQCYYVMIERDKVGRMGRRRGQNGFKRIDLGSLFVHWRCDIAKFIVTLFFIEPNHVQRQYDALSATATASTVMSAMCCFTHRAIDDVTNAVSKNRSGGKRCLQLSASIAICVASQISRYVA